MHKIKILIYIYSKIQSLYKVILPLVEKYFNAHKDYFISTSKTSSMASLKEKEMTALYVNTLYRKEILL